MKKIIHIVFDKMELALKFINSLSLDKEFKKQLGLEKCIITNESTRSNIIFRSKEVKCYKIVNGGGVKHKSAICTNVLNTAHGKGESK